MTKHNGQMMIGKDTAVEAQQDVLEARIKEQYNAKREERKRLFLEDQKMLALQTVIEGVTSGLYKNPHEALSKVASMKTPEGKPAFYVGYMNLCLAYDNWLKSMDVRSRTHWMQNHDLKGLEKQAITLVNPSKRDFPAREDAPRPDNGMSPYSQSCHDYTDPDEDTFC